MTTKFLGTCDDVTTCDCCGKKNLKRTVSLSIDDSEAVYYGVTCAARALKLDMKVVRSETKRADDEKHQAKMRADRIAWETEHASWFAFLAKFGKGTDTFSQIESLGGYEKARAQFEGSK